MTDIHSESGLRANHNNTDEKNFVFTWKPSKKPGSTEEITFELRKNGLMYVDLDEIGSDCSDSEENLPDDIISGFTTLNLFHNSSRNLYGSERLLKQVQKEVGTFISKNFGVDVEVEWSEDTHQSKHICNFDLKETKSENVNLAKIKSSQFVTTNLEVFWNDLFLDHKNPSSSSGSESE